MPTCKKCGKTFPNRITIDQKIVNVSVRKYCIDCSPYKNHNTKKLEISRSSDVIDDHKRCPKCKKMLPIEEFYRRRERYDKPHSYCKRCNELDSLSRVRNVKQRAVEYKGGKCVKCGYNRCIGALDFHHIDPQSKDLNISKIKTRTFEKIIPELDKCILVCSNCHREIHYLETIKKEDEMIFNIENTRTKTRYQHANDFEISKDVLEEMVVNKSTQSIANEFGVSMYAVESKRIQFDIIAPRNKSSRSSSRKFDPSREELERLVWEMPTEHIGEKYGVSGKAIENRCKTLGIEKPGRGYWAKQHALKNEG